MQIKHAKKKAPATGSIRNFPMYRTLRQFHFKDTYKGIAYAVAILAIDFLFAESTECNLFLVGKSIWITWSVPTNPYAAYSCRYAYVYTYAE